MNYFPTSALLQHTKVHNPAQCEVPTLTELWGHQCFRLWLWLIIMFTVWWHFSESTIIWTFGLQVFSSGKKRGKPIISLKLIWWFWGFELRRLRLRHWVGQGASVSKLCSEMRRDGSRRFPPNGKRLHSQWLLQWLLMRVIHWGNGHVIMCV